VQEQDVRKFAQLMRDEWARMVERDGGVVHAAPAALGADEEPPCPACGTAAPLVAGACSDCGLQLE
jgi:hypothetical protein